MKNSLFELFSNIGVDVREVHAKRNIKLRGQAFIVCGDEDQAEQAIKQLRGTMFFGKPLRLNYAKRLSDVIAKMKGTFDESSKAKREDNQKVGIASKEIKKKKKLIDRLFMLREQVKQG